MQVYFNGYTEEHVPKGKTGYYKMVVSYSYQGNSKTQTIMSFANPSVYDAIKKAKQGETLEVTLTSDGKYTNWASATVVAGTLPNPNPEGSVASFKAPAARSTYETPEERALKQVLIVKQSCLSQAAAYASLRKDGYPSVEEHLNLAQQFVDWVFSAQGIPED